MTSQNNNIPFPAALKMSGSLAAEWKRFRSQWQNYETAADLANATTKKRAAVFLACVGTEAYELYQTMQFASEEASKEIDNVIEAFERHCVGETNVTYERYEFNRRVQEPAERFDNFLAAIRRLVRTCEYGTLEESILRDRIVMGIRDDATRRKMLQTRKLTLEMAIDICKSSEAASRQLKAIASPDEVNAMKTESKQSRRRSPTKRRRESSRDGSHFRRDRQRASSAARPCQYCNRQHAPQKTACPAYGQVCRRCNKKHHFESVCRSKMRDQTQMLYDEQLLALGTNNAKRVYSRLHVENRSVRFMLDCGSTVNLLPQSIARAIDPDLRNLQAPTAKLRMFDHTELQTLGMMIADVEHPHTGRRARLEFYVPVTHRQPILGMNACLEFELLTINDENICAVQPFPPSGRLTKEDLTHRYADLFEGQGTLSGLVHLDIDPSVKPVQMPLRRLPLAITDKVKAELARMTSLGIIEPVTEPSDWISALVVASKPNGSVRICIDPKPLNKALKRSHYRIPNLEDVLPRLGQGKVKVLSSVDTKDGFWHLRLDDDSSKLTTFETPFGRYRWLRLPFGISISPELFQARMHEALKGLEGTACIADDVLIFGYGDDLDEAVRDHDRNIIALFERCRKEGIKLNKSKLQLNRTELTFMGNSITSDGLRPDPKKVEAIQKTPPPTDRHGVLRLLGMATYLAKFCPNFSEVTAKIRELLRKDVEFRWDENVQGVAFNRLKEMLSQAPVLQYFRADLPVTVQADASQSGIGAVLLQSDKPVAYVSRAMTDTDQAFAQIEKELLAIVFAMEKFDHYVYGREVTVETDHRALVPIRKKALSTAPRRLQKMLLRLQRYDLELVYKPGTQVIVADALSRAYPPPTADANAEMEELAALCDDEQMRDLSLVASKQTIDRIRAAAADDEQYKMLQKQIMVGWPESPADVHKDIREYSTFCDELTSCDGLIFKGQRVVIPRAARPYILERIHASHLGINGTIRRAREIIFYPGMAADIKRLVGQCAVCERYQQAQQKEPLLFHPAPSRPWEKVGVDIFTFKEHDYLICVCYLSGFFEIDRLPSKRVCDIVYCMKQHFARHGIASEVFSDNSPFRSAEFHNFAHKYGFQHNTSSPIYSQSNGRVENSVKTAKAIMTKAAESGNDPFLSLLDWRNTPSESLGASPAQILMGRRTRTQLPTTAGLLINRDFDKVSKALTASKKRQAIYYDVGARKRPPIPLGQTVRVKLRADAPDYKKAEVVKQLPFRSYIVRPEDGTERRRNARHVRFSSEPPIVFPDAADSAPTSQEVTPPPTARPPPSPPPPTPMPPPTVTTRSGRRVRKPARYRE